MISFQYLPNSGQIFFGSAYILLMVIALFLMVISYTSQMEGKYISISVALFLFSFMILQGLCDVMVILNRRWYRTLFSALVNSLPWILLLGFLLFIAGVEGYCLWKFWKKQKKQLTADAMKESLDNLPDGICFYSRDGQPLLVNHQMNRLSGELFGTEILNGNQFLHQLEREEFIGHGQIIRRKPNLMLQTDNQTVWEFHNKELVLNDNVVSELIASDVTEQYQMAMELEKRNRSLNQINRQLRIYNSEVNRITREQEILGAKVRIHDDVGRSLLAARAYLSQPKEQRERKQLLLLWDYTISSLKKEAKPEQKSGDWELLQKAASAVNVKITLNHPLPEEEKLRALLVAAIYECMTNTVKHADGDEVYVETQEKDAVLNIHLTNNGKPPSQIVKETGGLSNLRKIIETAGGIMKIESEPRFMLELELPKGEENE